jgi:hypothetical protein
VIQGNRDVDVGMGVDPEGDRRSSRGTFVMFVSLLVARDDTARTGLRTGLPRDWRSSSL